MFDPKIQSIVLLLLLLTMVSCAVNPVTGRSDFVMMSEEQEIALGRQSHDKILDQYGGAYDDPALQAYVQRIGESLAVNSHRSQLIYRFTVVDSPLVNAFALPGGYIYITRGLLAYLNSEAELAAVLGHEIGHVTARHSVRQISAARAAGLGYTVGSILVPELRTQVVEDLFNVLGSALISGYGREHELESDRLGAEYLAKTGYDPQAMVNVIGILKNQELFERQLAREEGREPRVYHGVFATHPRNDKRLQQAVASAQQYGRQNRSASRTQDRDFVRRLDGLVFGDSERYGIVRHNTFYHRQLDFAVQMPAHWQVDNRPDRIIAQAPKGAAMLQMTMEDLNKRISPAEFIQSRLNFDSISAGENMPVGDLEGYTGLVDVRTNAGPRTARVAVIYYHHQAYIFIGVSQDNSPGHDADFLKTAKSFHRLSSSERQMATALKMAVRKKQPADSFAALASHSPLINHAEEQLRLLNGYYPAGEVATGQWIKLVQ